MKAMKDMTKEEKHLRLRSGKVNQVAWDKAYLRTFSEPTKTQYELYLEILKEGKPK